MDAPRLVLSEVVQGARRTLSLLFCPNVGVGVVSLLQRQLLELIRAQFGHLRAPFAYGGWVAYNMVTRLRNHPMVKTAVVARALWLKQLAKAVKACAQYSTTHIEVVRYESMHVPP